MNGTKKDLIVLVADRSMEAAIRGILSRRDALDIQTVQADIYRHPQKDPGCRTDGASFLDSFSNQYEHALLIFDYAGCGDESTPACKQEESLKKSMAGTWGKGRAQVVIIEPELDVWVWSDSPHVDEVIGWRGRHPALRRWLQEEGFLAPGSAKPQQPKEALEAALRSVKKPRSSSMYFELAQRVSLERCDDQAFLKLKAILKRWFRR